MKNWPRVAIENKLITFLVFGLGMVLCIYSYMSMPQSEDPILDIPTIGVLMIYPGASSIEIESQIAEVAESAFQELDNVVEISTSISEGNLYSIIEFEYGSDAESKKDEVLSKISDIRPELPAGIYETEIIKYSTTEARVFQLALVSEIATYREMREVAENLKKSFERIRSAKDVEIEACPKERIGIRVDPKVLEKYQISPYHIEQAIQSENAIIAGGELNIGTQVYNVKTSGSFKSIDDIKNTIVKNVDGQLFRLSQVAEVGLEYERSKYKARYNGKKAVFITAKMKNGKDIFSLRANIERQLKNSDIPSHIEHYFVFDQAESVSERIDGFTNNLFQGVLLVGILCLIILGWRPSIMVMIAIPTSILAGLCVTSFLGYTLNQITIAGLVIALGLLVDDAIAIIENTNRFISKGKSYEQSAIKGTTQILGPAFSGTITTILAFIPIMMVPDVTGAFIRPMSVAVIATLFLSFFIAILILPALFLVLNRRFPSKSIQNKPTFFSRRIKGFIEGPYTYILNGTIRFKYWTLLSVFLFVIFSFFIFTKVGTSFFPKADKPLFRILVDLPEGSNLESTEKTVDKIEAILLANEEVDYVVSNIGHGNPHIYYNMSAKEYSNRHADILVNFKSFDVVNFKRSIDLLRDTLATIDETQIVIKEFVQGPNADTPIHIELQSDNLSQLKNYASVVERELKMTTGVKNVVNQLAYNTIDLSYNINKEKAIQRNLQIDQIDDYIRTMLSGKIISDFLDAKGDLYPIELGHYKKGNVSLEDLEIFNIPSYSGELIPLNSVATLKFVEGNSSIQHKNTDRIAFVQADIEEGMVLSNMIDSIDHALAQHSWAEGITYTFRGVAEAQDESFGNMGFASLLSFLLIFSVLVVQFRSFTQPLIIFSALPFAIGGAVILLYITGVHISFTGFVGFTSLIGIAINNTIILVEFANRQVRKGKAITEAIIKAAQVRFVPILLTTLTTILGLLPLTIWGGSFWQPMGMVIIGGLISSTILVLVVIPIMYVLITKEPQHQKGSAI